MFVRAIHLVGTYECAQRKKVIDSDIHREELYIAIFGDKCLRKLGSFVSAMEGESRVGLI